MLKKILEDEGLILNSLMSYLPKKTIMDFRNIDKFSKHTVDTSVRKMFKRLLPWCPLGRLYGKLLVK